MIRKWCLLVCLVALFCTEISAQICSKLHRVLQNQNKNNLKLLQSKMNVAVHLQCMADGNIFSSSEDVFRNIDMSREENVKVAIEEILQQISLVFDQNYFESAWDEKSMVRLQQRLHQQTEQIKKCWNTDSLTDKITQQLLTKVRVKAYFKRIRDFLKKEKYSQCAWESVQTEVYQFFLMIDQLTKRIYP